MKIYIDEAGRGPLAGPLALGAIINLGKERLNNPLFKDSKLLSAKKREEACLNLYQLQQQGNILIAKSMISPQTIDRYGVTQSLQLGILKILYTLLSQLLDETPQSRYQLSDIQELIGRWNQSREKIQLIIDGNSDF